MNEKQKSLKSQQEKKSFSQINFETIVILLKLKVVSYEKALFLFFTCFLILIIANMNIYGQSLKNNYEEINTNATLYVFLNSLEYADIIKLISLSQIITQIAIISVCIYTHVLTILYVICIFDRYFNENSKPRKYFYGRWFAQLQSFFSFVFFYPFSVILLSFIFCSQELLQNSNFQECSTSDPFYLILLIFSIVSLVLILVIEWFSTIFFQNLKQYKKDQLSVDKNPYFQLYFSILKFSIALFRSYETKKNIYFFAFQISFQFVLSLFIYYQLIFKLGYFHFGNQNIKQIFVYFFILMLSQFLAQFTDEIRRFMNILQKEQEYFIILTFFYAILLIIISERIRQTKLLRTLLSKEFINIKKTSLQEILIKMQYIQEIARSQSIQDDTLFKGLINNHLIQQKSCIQQSQNSAFFSCFCLQKSIYDPKKYKEVFLKKIFSRQNNSIFSKFLVKRLFEQNIFNENQDSYFFIKYAEFLYFKLKNVPLSLYYLYFLRSKYLPPLQQFHLYRLKYAIIKQNRKQNRESYQQNLELQNVLPSETQMEDIQSRIKYILKNNIQFWGYLERNLINLHDINIKIKQSFAQIAFLKNIWRKQMRFLHFKKKWTFYYAWYFLYILNKKVKISLLEKFSSHKINENDIFSEELIDENQQNFLKEDDLESVSSNIKPENYDQIKIKRPEIAFDMNSLVLHVDGDFKSNIIKVNRSIFHLFGFTAQEIERKVTIDKFMPRIYGKIHADLIQNFVLTGKSKSLYSQRKVFCANKSGDIFQSYKFVKQFITLQGNCEYITLLRPIKKPSGLKQLFLLLNENWEVDSMSDVVYETLGLNPQVYQNQNQILNFLIICPSLIQYTKYIQFSNQQEFQVLTQVDQDERSSPQVVGKNKKVSLFKNEQIQQSILVSDSIHLPVQNKQTGQFQIRKSVIKEIADDVNSQSPLKNSSELQDSQIEFQDEINERQNIEISRKIKKQMTIKLRQSLAQVKYQEMYEQTNYDYNPQQSIQMPDSPKFSENQEKQQEILFNESLLNGEDVNFSLIIPKNINEIMFNYQHLIKDNLQDQEMYEILKNLIIKYKVNCSTNKIYKCNCRLQIKQINYKYKILIIKLNKFEKQVKKKLKIFQKKKSNLSVSYEKFFSKKQKSIQEPAKMSHLLPESIINSSAMLNVEKGAETSDNLTNMVETQYKNEENDDFFNRNRGYQQTFEPYQDNNTTQISNSYIFQKDFINRQGCRNFNLSQNENIYIKEDNHKSNKEIIILSSFSLFLRVFFLFLVFINMFTFFYCPHKEFTALQMNAEGIYQSKKITLTIFQSYNTILDLIFLNKGLYTFDQSIIWKRDTYEQMKTSLLSSYKDYFKQIIQQEEFSQTLFNQNITPFQFTEIQLLSGYQYQFDSYDIISQYVYNVISLAQKNIQEITLNIPEIAFIRENLFPFISDELMKQSDNLVQGVEITSQQLWDELMLIVIIQSVFIFLSFILLFRYIILICNTFQSVIEVLPKIDQQDLKKIKNYNINLYKNFKYITQKDDLISGTILNSKSILKKFVKQENKSNNQIVELQEEITTNITGKKQKQIHNGMFLQKTRLSTAIYYAIFSLLIVGSSSLFLYEIIFSSNQLYKILENGQVFMKPFHYNIVIMSAIKEKILDIQHYEDHLKPQIQNIIQNFLIRDQTPYVEQISEIEFDLVFDKVFYKTPCAQYVELIQQQNTQECETIALQSLNKGVSTFNAFYQNTFANFLKNIDKSDEQQNSEQILEYDRGVYFSDIFIMYLIEEWSNETKNYLTKKINILSIYLSVIISLIFFSHFFINERLLIGNLTKEYAYFRSVYKMYMPDEIILKEKRIKFWLVKHYVLNK